MKKFPFCRMCKGKIEGNRRIWCRKSCASAYRKYQRIIKKYPIDDFDWVGAGYPF
jgi:hypothetical protein